MTCQPPKRPIMLSRAFGGEEKFSKKSTKWIVFFTLAGLGAIFLMFPLDTSRRSHLSLARELQKPQNILSISRFLPLHRYRTGFNIENPSFSASVKETVKNPGRVRDFRVGLLGRVPGVGCQCSESDPGRELDVRYVVVYTKPDCPLCDSMKKKVQGLIDRAQFLPSPLSAAELLIRDISTNPDWSDDYLTRVPVVAVAGEGGKEVEVEVLPRVTADKIEREILRVAKGL
ncbi:hypothetical protein AAMO2058_000386800 [Amorphochlora amoebiformis]